MRVWLHVPRPSLASALEQDSLTAECTPPWGALARSATWNESSRRPSYLRRVFETAHWTTDLSGLTCSPSTAERGVAAFVASLPAFPANPIASPGSGSERTTSETSGLIQPSLFELSPPTGSSSRTSPASRATTTLASDRSYGIWVSGLRSASSRRRRLARHTGGSGSSSWPTATGADASRQSLSYMRGNSTLRGMTLRDRSAQWPTPRGEDSESAGAHRGAPDGLTAATELWATPRGAEWKGTGPEGSASHKHRLEWGYLDAQAESFRPSLPAPETTPPGAPSSASAPTSRRQLNPLFVEWLMGWQVGWTSLAPLDCGSRETGSCHRPSSTPSGCSGDNWPTPDGVDMGGAMRAERKGKHALSLHHAVAEWKQPLGEEGLS